MMVNSSDDEDAEEVRPTRPAEDTFGQRFPKHKLHWDFFEAVKRNDIVMVTEFLKNPDIDVHFHDKAGMQVLSCATQLPTTDICQMLLAAGADVNSRNAVGRRPLHFAALNNAEMCKILLNSGAKEDNLDEDGDSALHFAAMRCNIESIQVLIDKGVKVDVTNKRMSTPLHMTVDKSDKDKKESKIHKLFQDMKSPPLHAPGSSISLTVKCLIDNGADVNAINKSGETPLLLAVRSDLGAVKELVARGADVNLSPNYHSPMSFAAMENNLECFRILLEAGGNVHFLTKDGNTLLHFAVLGKSSEIMQILIKAGCRWVTLMYTRVHSVLHEAAQYYPDGFKLLLDSGTRLDITMKDGDYPVHYAARCKTSESLRHLLDKGATIDVVNSNGQTPLHVAAEHWSPEALQLLIDLGADVNAVDKDGNTPLIWVIKKRMYGRPEGSDTRCLSILLDAGADKEMKNNEGLTPLHMAVEEIKPSILKFLIERGADMNAVDKKGLTPLHHAALLNTDCVEILLEAGVDSTIRAKNWLTAEQLCLQEANKEDECEYRSSVRQLKPVRILNHDILKKFRTSKTISQDK